MKKIFTKLTLFALALVGGTQMAMAASYELSVATKKVEWKNSENTSYQTLTGTEDADEKLTFNSENPLYLKFSFGESITSDDFVSSAVLLWDLFQKGNLVEITISCDGNELKLDNKGEGFAGTGDRKGSQEKKYELTTSVTNLLQEYLSTHGQMSEIEFKFTSNNSTYDSRIGVDVEYPLLEVNCGKVTKVDYYVSLVDATTGKVIGEKTNIGEGPVGTTVYLAEVPDYTNYMKSFYDEKDGSIQYVYNEELTGAKGKTNIQLTDGGSNTFVLYFTRSVVAFTVNDFKKYPNSTYCNFDKDLDFSKSPLLNAYILTTIEGNPNYVRMQAIDQVPAGVAVYLEYIGDDADESGSESPINIPLVDNYTGLSAQKINQTNILRAYKENMKLSDLEKNGVPYVLASDGFRKAIATSETSVLKSGRACIFLKETVAAQAGTRLTLIADDEATAVAEVEAQATSAENVIYNMQGVRVQSATAPGLYIINGKKVLVK